MQYTRNYNLKKPDYTDFADIKDINDNIDKIDEELAAPTGDTADSTATFTCSDVADGDAAAWTNVPALTSGETHKSLFAKMSQMFKNIRFLYKLLGTTDISSIGNGTVTGGLSSLNDSFNHVVGESLTITGGVFYARRAGKVVTYSWLGNATTVADDVTVGTLSESLRPLLNTFFVIRNDLTSYKGCYVAISTAGVVTVNGGGGARSRGNGCAIALTEHV